MIPVNLKRFCQKGSDLVFTSFFKRYKKLLVFLSTCLILVSYLCIDCFASIGFIDSTDSPDLITPFNCIVSYDTYSSGVTQDPDHLEDFFYSQVYFNLPNVFYSSEFNTSPSFTSFSDTYDENVFAFSEISNVYSSSVSSSSELYNFNLYFSLDAYTSVPCFIREFINIYFYNCLLSNSTGDIVDSVDNYDYYDGTAAYINLDPSDIYTGISGYIQGSFLFGATEYYTQYPVHYFDSLSITYTNDIYLNYYYVLINSNIPWEDYEEFISDHLDYDYFLESVSELRDTFSLSDYRPTGLDFKKCRELFAWCPAILGDFYFVPRDDFTPVSEFLFATDFSCRFSVIDKNAYSSFYESLIQDAIWNGKSGFERVSWFLGTAVSGFLSLEIMPNFSFAGLLIVIVSFSVVLWWLKVFAGG